MSRRSRQKTISAEMMPPPAASATSAQPPARRAILFISLLLIAITLLLFARTGGHGFVNYDDQIYVIDNVHVSTGVTAANIRWAFLSGHAANWHPLTWLSHMLDCQLFGLNPGPHHLVNITLHGASTVLLFLALLRLTGFVGRSAVVALLFALHPTHVESVAWISERKDVLSALFWFATMLAYARYATRPTAWRYSLVALFFALGLMSKPMVVTLPCVLLLLDYWPLHRFRSWAQFWRMFLEKLPLFALAFVASAITFGVQNAGGAVASGGEELLPRLGRVLLTYLFYLQKTFWPSALIIPYWTEFEPTATSLAAAGAIVLLVTAAALKFGGRIGYLPVGWFWFLGTLVPVIGLVRVGSQSAADRYTYLPSVGLFILVTWGVADLCARWRIPRAAILSASVALLGACAVVTHRQVGYWKNSITLFQHTLDVDPANILAVDRLAWTYATDLDPKLRNGAQALHLATIGVQLTERHHPLFLQTLAAAHAELEQFDLALQVAAEALQRIEPGQEAHATEIQTQMALYRAGRAIHRKHP